MKHWLPYYGRDDLYLLKANIIYLQWFAPYYIVIYEQNYRFYIAVDLIGKQRYKYVYYHIRLKSYGVSNAHHSICYSLVLSYWTCVVLKFSNYFIFKQTCSVCAASVVISCSVNTYIWKPIYTLFTYHWLHC